MDGLFYLMSVVGVGVVMWWVMQNDHVPPNRPTTGLFAMFTGAEVMRRRGLRGLLARVDNRQHRQPERPKPPA